jgi:myo-inositol-1(or 4)-monophosphatase
LAIIELEQLNHFKQIALSAAIDASESLLVNAKKINDLKIKNKPGQGIATNADIESEDIIVTKLKKNFPHHKFICEESAFDNASENKIDINNDTYWIIDPLDGTNNYVNRIPYYCISIALVHQGQTLLGLVLAPESKELYLATLNQPMHYYPDYRLPAEFQSVWNSTSDKLISDCVFMADLNFSIEGQKRYEKIQHLYRDCRGVRRFGAAALDMCLVARGVLDGMWQFKLSCWDQAAASLICKQASVQVLETDGFTSVNPFSTSILCARAPLIDSISTLFRK